MEAHLTWARELALGQRLHIESLVLGVDAKRVRVFHRLFATDAGYAAATMDVMMLHVVQGEDGCGPARSPRRLSASSSR